MELLKFIPPNYSNDAAVLLIESEKYLQGVKKLMPNAQFVILESWDLPIEPKIFDVIIAENALTYGENFYRRLAEINHLLKDSGFMLTQFFNVRFIGVLESLKRGIFSAQEERFWAKFDIVKILNDANYKEINFLPFQQIEIPAAEWENFGFDNFNDDLNTKIWLVKASKCTAEVAALKELYTYETRAELSRLLHRVEYDIEPQKNLTAILELCRRENIFNEYLADFIEQTVIHKEKVFNLLHPNQ